MSTAINVGHNRNIEKDIHTILVYGWCWVCKFIYSNDGSNFSLCSNCNRKARTQQSSTRVVVVCALFFHCSYCGTATTSGGTQCHPHSGTIEFFDVPLPLSFPWPGDEGGRLFQGLTEQSETHTHSTNIQSKWEIEKERERERERERGTQVLVCCTCKTFKDELCIHQSVVPLPFLKLSGGPVFTETVEQRNPKSTLITHRLRVGKRVSEEERARERMRMRMRERNSRAGREYLLLIDLEARARFNVRDSRTCVKKEEEASCQLPQKLSRPYWPTFIGCPGDKCTWDREEREYKMLIEE